MYVYEAAMKEKKFPDISKKANEVPVHKKRRKEFIK